MTPDEIEAVRERFVRTENLDEGKEYVDALFWSARDVPALLADLDAAREELRRAEQERDGVVKQFGFAQMELQTVRASRGVLVAKVSLGELALARAEAERDRMRPVVEAVRQWRIAELPPDAHNKVFRALNALAVAFDAYEHPEDAAVDTYEKTQESSDGR